MFKRTLFISFFILCCVAVFSFIKNDKKENVKQRVIKTIIVDAGHGIMQNGGHNGAKGVYSYEDEICLAVSKELVKKFKDEMPEIRIVESRPTEKITALHRRAEIANENKGDLFLCIHADSGPLKTSRRQIGSRTVTRYKITYTGKGKRKKKKSTPYKVTEPVYEYFKLPMKARGTSVYIFAAHKTSAKLKAIMDDVGEFEIETNEGDSSYTPIDYSTGGNKVIAQIYAKRFQEKSDLLATLVNDEVDKTGRTALGVNQRQVGIAVLQATNMPAILIETGFINNAEDERYLNSSDGQQELAVAITLAVKRYREQIENQGKVSSK